MSKGTLRRTLIVGGAFGGVLLGACSMIGKDATAPSSEAMEIVSRCTAVFSEPPQRIPTGAVVDAPLLGNGDVGVAVAGPPQYQLFYIGKNDFWSRHFKNVNTVGGVALEIPALRGAAYHQEQDLAQAEVRGEFATDLATLRARSWVAEGENLLVTELACETERPVPVDARNWAGQLRAIENTDKPLCVGCEQRESGRWFFHGLIDEVRVYSDALSLEEARTLSLGKQVRRALVRHWDFSEAGGSVAWDVAGTGNWGAPRGATWKRDVFGPALFFDGKGAYVDAGDLEVERAVTVAAWIKPESLNLEKGQANYVVSKGEWNQAFSLGLSEGKPRWTAAGAQAEAPLAVKTGEWTHLAGVFDGQTARLYVDGRLAAENRLSNRPSNAGVEEDVLWVTRSANPEGVEGRRAAIATRVIGAPTRLCADGMGNALRFDIRKGQCVFLVSAILSDLDAPAGPRRAAVRRVAGLTPAKIEGLNRRRQCWWRDFWSKSRIEIGDPLIEKFYYGSHYIMACCSRTGKAAPGLFGNWITTDRPDWNGDYHLNYNYEAPWWGVYSSNRVELADPYDPPLMDFLPIAKEYAAEFLGMPGSYFPVGIGPWGIHSDPNFWRQKSNGAYATTNMIMRWRHTYDREYLERCAYPFMIAVADFWEGYLRFEDGRYMIYNDAIHEGQRGDVNPILSLGLLRTLFATLIEASEELGVDADRRGKWRHILEHLPDYAYQEREGKRVFRYTEKGMDWCPSNTLGIQHIWPGGAVGLDSDPDLLKVCRDTVTVLNRWSDYNGFPTFYTAAARVGYDPEAILANLRKQMENHSFPNLFIYFGGGGIETCGGTTSAINEMLLQSHEGVLRLFPVWPRNRPARFRTLRAVGAFLVSSAYRDGEVQHVEILSEKGRDCTVQNPWPGRKAILQRPRGEPETLEGERFTFKTRRNERVLLLPPGTFPGDVE
ncbi:MAG TPA: LamG-like jellyroll fold domain-containing protein [Sumerlaeia bacterium]|nr:LamG-like jellyroll fold domain-containing protein [Sumerlaeia bacterium]